MIIPLLYELLLVLGGKLCTTPNRPVQAIKGFLGPYSHSINRKATKHQYVAENSSSTPQNQDPCQMSYYEKIDSFVKKEMTRSDAGAHAYDHVKRVFSLVMRIGTTLGANLRILGAAALLHDIGRAQEEERRTSHSILSGEMSVEILEDVGFSKDEIQSVRDAIRTHRFSEGLTPTSLEGEILSDADKLDALGAIGVVRAIAQAATTGAGAEVFLRHADEKLLKLHQMMYTEEGKKMAKDRHSVLSAFVTELRKELGDIES
jgi:uncharacterized protein